MQRTERNFSEKPLRVALLAAQLSARLPDALKVALSERACCLVDCALNSRLLGLLSLPCPAASSAALRPSVWICVLSACLFPSVRVVSLESFMPVLFVSSVLDFTVGIRVSRIGSLSDRCLFCRVLSVSSLPADRWRLGLVCLSVGVSDLICVSVAVVSPSQSISLSPPLPLFVSLRLRHCMPVDDPRLCCRSWSLIVLCVCCVCIWSLSLIF